MRHFTDEEIMAYADGEATPEQSRAIAEAVRNDPKLAARVAQFEDTRRVLREAFAKALSEPVPARLKDTVSGKRGNGAGARADKVVSLGGRRAPHAPQGAPQWVPLALAASVTLAIGLALGGWWTQRAATSPEMVASATVDPAMLSQALEQAASGVPVAMQNSSGRRFEVVPVSAIRTADGGFCREFESSVEDFAGKREARGLACRQGDGQWATQAIAAFGNAGDAGAAPAGGYRAASGGTMDFAAALAGARRLTPDEEKQAIGKHWSAAAQH